MTADWPRRRLGEVLRLEYGASLPERLRRPGSVAVMGSAGQVGTHDSALIAGPGIVIGRKGSIGEVRWVEGDFFPIDTTYYVVPVEMRSDVRWAYHMLTRERLSRLNRATGVPGLSRDDVHALKRAIPPLPEQRAIAAVLDAIDEAIERTEAVIAATEALRKSLLHELLTRGVPGWHSEWKEVAGLGALPACWDVVRLDAIAEIVGGTTPSRRHPDYFGGPIPWVRPGDVTSLTTRFLEKTADTITEEGRAAAGLRMLPVETILLTSRATIGARAIAKVPVTTNQGFQNLIPGHGALNLWLYYTLEFRQRDLEALAAGSTFREFSRQSLRALRIAVPPLVEQKQIAAQLDSLDRYAEAGAGVVADLWRLKASAADALLTGRVRVPKAMELLA